VFVTRRKYAKPVLSSLPTFSPGQQAVTGVTYVPPMNARARVKAPVQHHVSRKGEWNPTGGTGLPQEFTWTDPVQIRQTLGWTPAGSLVSRPMDQFHCGSCWAVASATMLADRHAIWSNTPVVALSPTYIMQCMPGSAKCEGGFPSDAGEFLAKHGTLTAADDPYDWCSGNQACTQGPQPNQTRPVTLNNLVPKCPGLTLAKRVKAQRHTTQALVTPVSIQHEIWQRGPVVAVFRVFGDFVQGAKPRGDGWAATGGVYCHLPNQKLYDLSPVNCVLGSNRPDQCYFGNHAVVIVGWGVAKGLRNFLRPGGPALNLPYWIVRNSWGEHWNNGGYFKVAFSDPRTGLNVDLALDRPLRVNDQLFGGATVWDPAVPWATRRVGGTRPGSTKTPSSSKSSLFVILVGILTGLIVLMLALLVYMHGKPLARK